MFTNQAQTQLNILLGRRSMMRRFCNFMTGVCFLGVVMLAAIEPHDAPAFYIHAAMLTILSIGMAFFGITARGIRD